MDIMTSEEIAKMSELSMLKARGAANSDEQRLLVELIGKGTRLAGKCNELWNKKQQEGLTGEENALLEKYLEKLTEYTKVEVKYATIDSLNHFISVVGNQENLPISGKIRLNAAKEVLGIEIQQEEDRSRSR